MFILNKSSPTISIIYESYITIIKNVMTKTYV